MVFFFSSFFPSSQTISFVPFPSLPTVTVDIFPITHSHICSLYPVSHRLFINPLKHLLIETLSISLTYISSDAEALQVVFDPAIISYATLVEFFYKMHDPTTKNRQGGDAGTQYRSAIYWHDEEQEKIAKEITAKVGKQWWRASPVTTEVAPAGEWFDAEGYHQGYLDKTPGGYECPSQSVFPGVISFLLLKNMD